MSLFSFVTDNNGYFKIPTPPVYFYPPVYSTICNIIDESNKLNKNLSVISRVDFIFSALYKFGYRDKSIHMIKYAYTNIESKIKINGLLSDPLTIMLVRQGCLLSMLFVIQYCG